MLLCVFVVVDGHDDGEDEDDAAFYDMTMMTMVTMMMVMEQKQRQTSNKTCRQTYCPTRRHIASQAESHSVDTTPYSQPGYVRHSVRQPSKLPDMLPDTAADKQPRRQTGCQT